MPSAGVYSTHTASGPSSKSVGAKSNERLRGKGRVCEGNSDALCNEGDQVLHSLFGHVVQSPWLDMDKSLSNLTKGSSLSQSLDLLTPGNSFCLKLFYDSAPEKVLVSGWQADKSEGKTAAKGRSLEQAMK